MWRLTAVSGSQHARNDVGAVDKRRSAVGAEHRSARGAERGDGNTQQHRTWTGASATNNTSGLGGIEQHAAERQCNFEECQRQRGSGPLRGVRRGRHAGPIPQLLQPVAEERSRD